MRNLISELSSCRPSPWQVLHGFSTIRPEPLQCGQVCLRLMKPRDVSTTPCPPQVGQTRALEPCSIPDPSHTSQRTDFEMEMVFSQPSVASSRVISISSRKSSPRCGCEGSCRPPKNSSK